MKHCEIIACLFLVFSLFLIFTDAAAQSRVTPLKGQSVDQQFKDEADCHARAMEQSHYDPQAAEQSRRDPGAAGGRDSSSGAAFGAYGGRGAGAAVGAMTASEAARARDQKERAARRNAAQRQQDDYLKAKAACLQSRGYAVQ